MARRAARAAVDAPQVAARGDAGAGVVVAPSGLWCDGGLSFSNRGEQQAVEGKTLYPDWLLVH